jgi:hypothetical protein
MSNVIVLTPASTRSLTTVDIVREEFKIAQDAMTNSQIQRMIDSASSMIAVFCRRQFGLQTVRERLSFPASCGQEPLTKITVAYDPIVEVRSVSANGELVEPIDYEFNDTALFNLDDNGEQVPWYGRSFTLIYQGGYVLPGQDRTTLNVSDKAQDLPGDIQRAVLLLIGVVVSGSDRDIMIKAEETEGVGRTEYYVQGSRAQLPHPEAEALLLQYQGANI